ncbi:MAG: class I SAM-dependent methyltransferase [Candidatus Scalindua rubra]|uniref:Methyltransferase n=1 Tax=Candidatus Scalindua brodae TaxID=237368 RepID=A0A0B0EN34_9BACT|nr:MAG: methyltransferase [Candidatus Scalindua brodae]MBZ0110531.1 class I SAM-dependent methyltransferase [Candidatus Scalindua rubra]TWU30770.1 Ribosomal RNA large subunit methyltransferase I [Candidatus Brocadiaceae bacterium S225]
MKLNSTKLKFRTLCPPLSLANRIKEGLPRLILDRLPEDHDFTETGWCKLRDSQGAFLSWGCIDPVNNAMQLISSSEGDPGVDLVLRFENALKKRSVQETSKKEVVRLVNGPGDNLSGFFLDSYGSTLILSLESWALSDLVDYNLHKVMATLKPEHIILKIREKGRKLKGKLQERALLGMPMEGKIRVQENGISYLVQPMGSLDTGLFFDLRGARKEFAQNAKGKSVLNLFSYTGAFSLTAAIAGASQVVSVDTSPECHKWARENFELNNIDHKAERFRFIKDNVFNYIEKLVKRSESYERIILDPPVRSIAGTGRFFLKSDLYKLVASCLKIMSPKGRLLVTDNTMQGTAAKLTHKISKGSEAAGIPCTIIKTFEPEPDFPVHPFWPKGQGVIAMEVERT